MTTTASTNARGVVRSIAWRPTDGEPMRVVERCTVLPRRGIDTENRKHGKREITLLSAEAWADACRELGTELPWHLRRANVLVGGLDLARTIGTTIVIGEVRVYVHGESKPCGIMDQQHAGLRNALATDGRGGVYGQVTGGGTIRVGDAVSVASP